MGSHRKTDHSTTLAAEEAASASGSGSCGGLGTRARHHIRLPRVQPQRAAVRWSPVHLHARSIIRRAMLVERPSPIRTNDNTREFPVPVDVVVRRRQHRSYSAIYAMYERCGCHGGAALAALVAWVWSAPYFFFSDDPRAISRDHGLERSSSQCTRRPRVIGDILAGTRVPSSASRARPRVELRSAWRRAVRARKPRSGGPATPARSRAAPRKDGDREALKL